MLMVFIEHSVEYAAKLTELNQKRLSYS